MHQDSVVIIWFSGFIVKSNSMLFDFGEKIDKFGPLAIANKPLGLQESILFCIAFDGYGQSVFGKLMLLILLDCEIRFVSFINGLDLDACFQENREPCFQDMICMKNKCTNVVLSCWGFVSYLIGFVESSSQTIKELSEQ